MKVSDIRSSCIKGFLDEAEGMKLHELAREAGRFGPCLEIGGYCGRSTLYLGLGCRQSGGVLFSIDHHQGSEEQQPGQEYYDPELFDEKTGRIDTFSLFRKAILDAGLEETVIPIVAPSELVARSWSTPLSMVFIDGGHTYAAAFSDYTAWSTHLLPGGILAIHDVFPDPAQGGQAPYYIYTLARDSGLFVEEPMVKTLGILRRLRTGQVPDDLRSRRDW
ncbi:MAG TPA: class I SAM-dependent methyltransferase [Deltaproteobacteria bacterium]|nr:class I SAM-dependent methyltransferase [Deltaproteobacteria bacterium]